MKLIPRQYMTTADTEPQLSLRHADQQQSVGQHHAQGECFECDVLLVPHCALDNMSVDAL